MVEKSDLKRLNQYTENTKWLLENTEKLRQKLPDRYVAVCEAGKKVLDSPNLDELLRMVAMSGANPEACAIDFITREVYALVV